MNKTQERDRETEYEECCTIEMFYTLTHFMLSRLNRNSYSIFSVNPVHMRF